MPKSVVILLAIGVVVARDPPDLRDRKRRSQQCFEVVRRLQISQNHDGVRTVLFHRLIDVIKLAMWISAEENLRLRF